jgi:NitT/TauT family transport system permease protein
VVFWASVWTALLTTISGVKAIDPLLIKSARSMGVSEFSLFRKVVLPASLPAVITGVRLSASSAVIILIAAEMLGGSKGIGILIYNSQQLYQTTQMYSGIITIALLGVVINKLLVLFEQNATVWKDTKNNS